jgi:hypothetical protein
MQETEDYEQTRNTTGVRRRRGLVVVGARCGVAQCLISILGSGPHQARGPLAHAAMREVEKARSSDARPHCCMYHRRLVELHDAAVDAQRSPVPLRWTVDGGLAAATRLMDLSQGRQDPAASLLIR